MTTDGNRTSVAVIGAGPAGLTAAYELVRRQVPVTVLEGDSMVGGISRTAEREGWRFDIGGHRFFTKNRESVVEGKRGDLWGWRIHKKKQSTNRIHLNHSRI